MRAELSGAAICGSCGAAFTCGMQGGHARCWCVELPPLEPVPGRGCLCRKCLATELRRSKDVAG